MRFRTISLIIILLASFARGHAQQSYYQLSKDDDFRHAMDLFEKEKYATAQQFFESAMEKYRSSNSELAVQAEYYDAMCAVRLFNDDAEYLTFKFIADNPESPLVNMANFNLAGYFYARKRWYDAIKYYKKVDVDKLDKEQMGELYFKLGYAYFTMKKYDKAKPAFYEIKDIDTKYSPPALYYYSHIHYVEGDYQTALNGMLRLEKDKTFGPIAPYYIVQIYYKQGRYKDIINYVPGIIDHVTNKRLAEVSRIAAEAYAQLGQYDKSLPYFQTFLDSSNVVTKEDKYQAGYAFYKAGKYDKAITLFGDISSTDSQLGQNASYYLADCYIKTNDKQKARLAFQSASSMDFDPVIKQDALFNYALLTYELGSDPFNEAISAFKEFIKLYPESKRLEEAYKYLIQAYLNARNYGMAMESLDKTPLNSDDMKKAYQRVAYYRGVELFNNLKFKPAIDCFNKSLKYGSFDQTLKADALYWKGEAYYRMGDYSDAISEYNDFKNSQIAFTVKGFKTIDYSIGYAWFQLKNYKNALESLRKFSSGASADLSKEKADALNRIGDCFYAQKDYYSAVDYYDRAAQMGEDGADYALLQKGICQGLINKDVQKIQTLQELTTKYPKSNYVDNAMYEIADSYVQLQNSDQAISVLKQMLNDHPNGQLAPEATLKLGILYYNKDQNDDAIRYYKQTVQKFAGTQAAKDALVGLKNIYVDMNKVNDYFAFVKGLGTSAPVISVSEQDSLTYISAEKVYMSGDCAAATDALGKYIAQYPQGDFLLNAYFYQADCNYRQKQFDQALTGFNFVLSQPTNMFTEQALLGCARIELQNKDYGKAIDHYTQLAQNYNSPGNVKEAYTGIMRAWFAQQKYQEALDAARNVQSLDKLSPEIEREATYIAARSLQETGRDALAIEEYKKLSGEVMSAEGAEAKYRLAELYYKQGDYKAAQKVILDFSQKTTPQDYWIARSFILWSDIFVKEKDYFQANQTLQSIIDYYEKSDDGILDSAKVKKAEVLKLQEAKEQPAQNPNVEVNVD